MATGMCLFLVLTFTVCFLKVVPSPLPADSKNKGCDMPSFREAEYYGFPVPHKLQTNVKIPFRCKEAYYDTPTYTICYGGNNWEALDPPCKLVKCDVPPMPMFGVARVEGQGYGGKASYSCNEGYQYTGTTERSCQRNGQWSGLEGHCNKIECIQPLLPHGSFTKGSVFGYKNKTVAVCEPGYVYNGSKEHVCLEDNRWSGTIGQCVETRSVRCPPFPDLAHLVVTPATPGGRYKDQVHLSCDPGFTYSGATSRGCLLNSSWSGQDGQCQDVFCERPTKLVQNGFVVDSCKQCAYKHVLQITCLPGYSYNGSVVICTGEGHWNGTIGRCNVVRCNMSLQVSNADIKMRGTVYKSTAIISCHSGYSLAGNDILHCRANGHWDKPGVCSASVNQGGVAAGIVVSLMVVSIAVLLILVYRHKKRNSEDSVKKELRSLIIKEGHLVYRPQDKCLDLSTEFVKPKIVPGETDDESFINSFRYDQYQKKPQGTEMKLKEIIKEAPSGGTTIIYGRGCVGKSAMVEYTLRKWADDKWGKNYMAFFFMHMRNPKLHDSGELTLVEFLHQFTIHKLHQPVAKKWLTTNEERISFFVDAVDALQDRQNEYKQVKPLSEEDKAKPFDWCVNILRRAVLKKTRLILTTRLFDWLNDIPSVKQYEITGLTRVGVSKMIDKHVEVEKRYQVRLTIINNPVLLSVSAITFFCLTLCKALQDEGPDRDDPDDLCTTTRVTAFIIQKYLERLEQKPTIFEEREDTEETPLLEQCPNSNTTTTTTTTTTTQGHQCMAPLAKLAYSGVRSNADLCHLKFFKSDLENANCTEEIVKVACQLGLVYSQSESPNGTCVQFLHLSIQLLLGMLELLKEIPDHRNEVIKQIWSSSESIRYLFGLMYDTNYTPIAQLRQLVGLDDKESFEDLLNILLEHLAATISDGHLRAVKLVYETQNSGVAVKVATQCFSETGTLTFTDNEELTDLDMEAIMFMMKHCPDLHTLELDKVILYETTQKQLSSSLSKNTYLKHLRLTGVHLSQEGVKSISESLKINQSLQSLSIDTGDIDNEKMGVLAKALEENSSLKSLSFHTNPFGNKGMVTLTSSLIKNTGVESVRFNERHMDGSQKDLVEKVKKQRSTPIEFTYD